ncbi:hypothetical protein RRG08_005156 [Elysia crispata]|uniref:Reverse transcriptase RNase H-like domain-containing protein n=1 Tax=Elysia crispata TaxID=231223 RepID=A0AAE0ZGW7_9GAST|nr:hypothetical protein RRG08_005156 [Elysia crispata]
MGRTSGVCVPDNAGCADTEIDYTTSDPNKTFILRTDTSNDGIGAVLMQKHDGKPYPVNYGSKKLTAAERNYSTIERECLAIVWGVKKFELYLQGVPFVLQTNHHRLNYLNSAMFVHARVMRWAMYLQNFNMRGFFITGSQNVGADYMSRVVHIFISISPS